MPVGRVNILPRSLIGLPKPCPIRTEVSGISAFHQPCGATSSDLVIVVVLPKVAVGVRHHLVRITELMPHYFQRRAIRFYPQRQSPNPNLTIVALPAAVILAVIRRPAGINTS